ncbi:MAG: hypothetical protein PWQ57_1242 [Desulfovibrionales bacterium]|nr:hypothetical protein [Desulfovibrionales bacterium]
MIRRCYIALIVSGCLFLLAGCSATTGIMLTNTPQQLPGVQCRGKVVIEVFKNAKVFEAIGQRDDQPLHPANMKVGRWAAKAVADQLAACGCEAVIMEKASALPEEWLVRGTVNQAYAEQTGLLTYQTNFTMNVELARGDKKLFGKKVEFSSEKTAALPSSDLPSKYLDEAVSDAAVDAAKSIIEQMGAVR